jgi:hypothetical protein
MVRLIDHGPIMSYSGEEEQRGIPDKSNSVNTMKVNDQTTLSGELTSDNERDV